jgi:hypothetical protein
VRLDEPGPGLLPTRIRSACRRDVPQPERSATAITNVIRRGSGGLPPRTAARRSGSEIRTCRRRVRPANFFQPVQVLIVFGPAQNEAV